MKRCFKCLIEKPLDEFYRHRMMADGHLSKCKDCARADVLANRLKNIERYREIDRERGKRPEAVASRAETTRRWAKQFPERRRAQMAVGNAIRDGRMRRADQCQGCGRADRKVQMHHPDYSKPQLVIWLCKPCHAIADKIRRMLEAS